MLQKNTNGTFDVVCKSEITIGNDVIIGQHEGKPIVKKVSEIYEQRKEKGIYVDEGNRRNWANVSLI